MKEEIPSIEKTTCDFCDIHVINDYDYPIDQRYKKMHLYYGTFMREVDVCPVCWMKVIETLNDLSNLDLKGYNERKKA